MKFNSASKSWLKKNWHWLILTAVAVSFFIGAASYNYHTQTADFIKWSSPDESSNYNFTKLYAQEGRLSFFEKYNLPTGDVIHPRSYRSDQGTIKPVSFLGLILIYGEIASLTSSKIIPYLTPFFAAIGLIFYFLLIKEIFGKKNALISVLIAASLPPLIYYSARSMFHNILFAVLLIISLYFACLSARGKKGGAESDKIKFKHPDFLSNLSAGLSGAFLGLAIISRASELIWLIPFWLVIWLANVKKIGLIKLMIFIACLLFAISPAAYWNKILYQSYWRGGYSEMNQSILNMASAGSEILKSGAANSAVIKKNFMEIKNNFFYFGWQPLKSLKMLYFYFAEMFYWIFWPAFFGFLLFLTSIKKWRVKHYVYLTSLFIAAVILISYYGSWDFHDNPDPKSHTIGNSYTRYWLPIYLGAIPLASFFFIKLTGLLRKKKLINGSRILIVGAIFFISLKFVLVGSAEGLIQSAEKHLASRQDLNKILNLTEANSVIITQYHDKLLFPERKVIVGLFNDEEMIKRYAVLLKYLPVYYYNFTFPEKDFNYLNEKRLAKFNFLIRPVEKVAKDFTLYRLIPLTPLTKGSPRPEEGAGDF